MTINGYTTCGLCVLAEVKGGPVRAADALDPAVGGEELGVPAVASVVRHLVGHVLTKPQLLGVRPHLGQEQLDAGHEIPNRLIGDQTL